MPLQLNNKFVTPPGGYRFFVKTTGKWFTGTTMDDLQHQLAAHCKIHALPVPSEVEIEAQICFELGQGASSWCSDEQGFAASVDTSSPDCFKLTLASVLQGTLTIIHTAASGRRVDSAEAEARAKTCSTCNQNREVAGCRGCAMTAIASTLGQIRGDRRTTLDGALKTCCLCGCLLQAKVWVPLDILLTHAPEAQLERIKTKAPACWMLQPAV